MRKCARQCARFRGLAAGLGTSGVVVPLASSMTRQTHTLPPAIYAAIPTPYGTAAAAKLSLASFVPAIVGLPLSDLVARWMLRLLGR